MRPRIHGDNRINVEVKWPNAATRMIESFMVATNSAIGHLLGSKGAPLPWRCHSPPDAEEVSSLNAKLSALGVDIELPMPSLKTHGQSDSEELSNLLGAWAQSSGGGSHADAATSCPCGPSNERALAGEVEIPGNRAYVRESRRIPGSRRQFRPKRETNITLHEAGRENPDEGE